MASMSCSDITTMLKTRTAVVLFFCLVLFVVLMYTLDIHTFHLDGWDVNHLPQVILDLKPDHTQPDQNNDLLVADRNLNVQQLELLARTKEKLDSILIPNDTINQSHSEREEVSEIPMLEVNVSVLSTTADPTEISENTANSSDVSESHSDTDHANATQHTPSPTKSDGESDGNFGNGFNSLFNTDSHYINGNPLRFDQCRNAILYKEGINIEDFLWEHTQHLDANTRSSLQQHIGDIVWSRELLDALNKSIQFQHLIRVRLSYDAFNPKDKPKTSRQRGGNEPVEAYSIESRQKDGFYGKQLAYYHVSKCGSSSIHNMLTQHYNTTRIYWANLLGRYDVLPDIDCAFTFVRHPIDRIISGYYTIMSMLDREFKHQSDGNKTAELLIQREYGKRHPWYMEEDSAKERFRLFVTDILESGYEYVMDDHLVLHVITQIGSSIGNFHLWPIDFMGRMELFEEHWSFLSLEHEKCAPVFDSISTEKVHDYKLAHSMKRMGHPSSIDSEDVGGDMGTREEMKKKGLSAEHFVFIDDRDLFERAVSFYYQDFVCFQYNMTYEGYLQHLDNKYIL